VPAPVNTAGHSGSGWQAPSVGGEGDTVGGPLRVLRLCSVFEPAGGGGRVAARFDPVGGMQTHTGELTRALDRRGVRQLVVTTRPPGAPRRERFGEHSAVVRLGLPVPLFRQGYAGPAAGVLARVASRVDLLHGHLGEDLAVVPLVLAAARWGRRPLVLTVHTSVRHTLAVTGPRSAVLKSVGGWWEQVGERRADAVIALTPRLAGLITRASVPEERVHVIPSGVPDGFFDVPHAVEPDGLPPRPRVVFLGRLHAQKAVDVLVRAVVMLPGVQLVLAGDGPQRAALRQLVDRLGVGNRVTFLGFVPRVHVPALLAAADVLALPSRYEELGTAVIEGMRAGVPVVAADTGGVSATITDGVTGLLVPPGQPAALAGALRRVLTDDGLARRLADAARERSRDYSWETLGNRVLGVYREVLQAHGSRG
jgi:glycogen synthase